MKVFLDFDDVLFDTGRFSPEYKHVFEQCGVDLDVFHKLSTENFGNSIHEGKMCHSFENHMHMLDQAGVLYDKKMLTERVSKFFSNLEYYVFHDVRAFLHSFNKEEIILLSYGDMTFQMTKVRESGLENMFDSVFITKKGKDKIIEKEYFGLVRNKKSDEIYFLDDRVAYFEDIKRKVPACITMLVSRPEGRYHDARTKWCDFQVKNLDEARAIIRNNSMIGR